MTKKGVESSVLNIVRCISGRFSPTEVREAIECKDITGDEVRSAIVRLIDRGKLSLDADMKLHIPRIPKRT